MNGRNDEPGGSKEAELRNLTGALRRGRISRRDFLTRAAALGVAAGTAGTLLGPGAASAQEETTISVEGSATGPESSENPRFGFVLSHEQFPAENLVEYAVQAEQAGFDMLWTSDHFHPWLDNEGHSMFPWNTLSLIGQQTERALFGPGVCCPIYRYQPAAVAQAYASMAIQSPGRVFLGLGTGEALNEMAATQLRAVPGAPRPAHRGGRAYPGVVDRRGGGLRGQLLPDEQREALRCSRRAATDLRCSQRPYERAPDRTVR